MEAVLDKIGVFHWSRAPKSCQDKFRLTDKGRSKSLTSVPSTCTCLGLLVTTEWSLNPPKPSASFIQDQAILCSAPPIQVGESEWIQRKGQNVSVAYMCGFHYLFYFNEKLGPECFRKEGKECRERNLASFPILLVSYCSIKTRS